MRAIADRFVPKTGGYSVLLKLDGRRPFEDWYPGSVQDAVTRARVDYPGCRILKVEEVEWGDWIDAAAWLAEDWLSGQPPSDDLMDRGYWDFPPDDEKPRS